MVDKEFAANKSTIKADEIDYARLAAFIDGEGTITIGRFHSYKGKTPQMRVEVMVTNTDPRLMAWLMGRFGGNVGRGGRRGTPHKCFKWRIGSEKAHDLIVRCLPYFVLKRYQAEIAIAFRRTVQPIGGHKRLSKEILTERLALRAAMQASRTQHLLRSDDYAN